MTYGADTFFAPRSEKLTPTSIASLTHFAKKLDAASLEVILVVGHADSAEAPNAAVAQALSLARADAVAGFFKSVGVDPKRVYVEGKGSTEPVASYKTADGRAKNRRVEIELVATRRARDDQAEAPIRPDGYVTVMFGTTRNRTGINDPNHYFGSDESTEPEGERLVLGRVLVRVPEKHITGTVKEPSYFSVMLEKMTSGVVASFVGLDPIAAANPKTHFTFAGPVEELSDVAFSAALKTSVEKSRRHSAMVYVHGFANTFKDAAFRTAQIAYDLKAEDFDLVPMMFSWPADMNYLATADKTWDAGNQLARFLEKLVSIGGAGKVHVIAHSKGAQVLGVALNLMDKRNLAVNIDGQASTILKLNQIILAAPDIRATDFKSYVLPAINGRIQVTNYVSSNDAALKLSKKGNAGARAGDSGSGLTLIKGVNTIDVTKVNYEPGGHASFAESPAVIADLRLQLSGCKPSQRGLQMIPRKNLLYWVMPHVAKGETVRECAQINHD